MSATLSGTNPRRALVTGAGGFIGAHLALYLASRGQPVTALDVDLGRLRARVSQRGLELIEADVSDADAMQRVMPEIDTVYHLAAAHLGVSIPAAEFVRVNVDGVRILAEAAIRAGVRRFVHCSSVGVFGPIRQPPADEETPCRPTLPYEESKLAGEQVILEAVRRGFPAVILRPAWVYGPGCARTEKLFRAIAKGRFFVAGRGRGLRHCLYIRDMLQALVLAAEVDEAIGQILVIGDDAAVTVRRLVDEIARLSGTRPPRSLPLWSVRSAALAVELAARALGREPPLSRRSLKFFTGNTAFDIGRARRVLGFRPRCDVPAGLAETHSVISAGESWDAAQLRWSSRESRPRS